jgi:hypothetical protein
VKTLTIGIGTAILALLALLTIQLILEAGRWERYVEVSRPPIGISDEEKIIQMKLSYYEKSADELKTLTSLMLGLSTVFGLALGVSSYFNLKTTKEQYETELKRLKETIDSEVLTLHRDFPLFRDLHRSISDMRFNLQKFIPESDYGKNVFGSIDTDERMMVMYFERTVATFEFFDLSPFKNDASSIYTMLGSYYSHKYSHEKTKFENAKNEKSTEKKKQRRPKAPNIQDVARARLYLRRAKEVLPDNFSALNEIGFLEVIVTNEPDRALTALRKSLELNGNQQRARYFLAITEHVAGANELSRNPARAVRNFRQSVELLEGAFPQEHWQISPAPAGYIRAMHYNCACGYARLGELEDDKKIQSNLFESAMSHLKQSFPIEKYEKNRKDALREDLLRGGDLDVLGRQAKHRDEIEKLTKQALGLTGPEDQLAL